MDTSRTRARAVTTSTMYHVRGNVQAPTLRAGSRSLEAKTRRPRPRRSPWPASSCGKPSTQAWTVDHDTSRQQRRRAFQDALCPARPGLRRRPGAQGVRCRVAVAAHAEGAHESARVELLSMRLAGSPPTPRASSWNTAAPTPGARLPAPAGDSAGVGAVAPGGAGARAGAGADASADPGALAPRAGGADYAKAAANDRDEE